MAPLSNMFHVTCYNTQRRRVAPLIGDCKRCVGGTGEGDGGEGEDELKFVFISMQKMEMEMKCISYHCIVDLPNPL